ncbi:MAG: membrane protein insertase YidC [Gammaproteobacteria bacterium]|nr:membrane protein insertase YidC [Gammaproteobacteria bacterium]
MDTQRLVLFLALSLVVMLLWDAWNQRYNPVETPNQIVEAGSASSVPAAPQEMLSTVAPETEDLPVSPVSTPDAPEKPATATQNALGSSKRILVTTDVFDLELETRGGDVRKVFLKKFPISLDQPQMAYPLMDDALPQLFIAQTGLLSTTEAPDHHSIFQSEQSEFRMEDGKNELVVPLTWISQSGIRVMKILTFTRGSYLINVEHKIENQSAAEWKGRLYRQLQRNKFEEPGKSRLLYTFTGAAVSSVEKPYQKIEFDEMAEWKPDQSYTKGGWGAMLQHYFVAAWIPPNEEANHFYTRALKDDRFIVGMTSSETIVAPGANTNFINNLYVGPKVQSRLEKIEPNLKLTVDYGILHFLAQPLFWVLEFFHSFLGNWGWSIIMLTLMIKVFFYKLSEASYRSMANMRALAPKFQAIRDRYGDDRQRMSQATMELYKKEKVNPLSGCWPMLVQIPVFISLYWMILESVELRQAPFILWIQDLSAKDPFYVLPIVMGVSMYFQQKLSANPSMDPLQQKILQFMPLVFTLFFMLFPAGLVLYWVVNNLLSILQQWYITHKIEKETRKA